jgi:hypothetical protein
MIGQFEMSSQGVAVVQHPFVTRATDQIPALNHKTLQCLERAGIVRREVEGREHWCSINPEPLSAANRWIAEQEAFWNQKLDRLTTFLATNKKRVEK